MGFMLGDPFNYSPVRKMAEAITFRTAADGTPNCTVVAGNADATTTHYSLEMYYSEPFRTDGDNYYNRPFSSFNARGDITWKDVPLADYGGNTLKLNDVSGSDGAAKLVIKPGWLVRLKIGVPFLYYSDDENNNPLQVIGMVSSNGVVDSNPNIIRADDEPSDANYFYTIVILDGDEGDYVSIDLDAEHGDIGQLAIKAGGVNYSMSGILDDATGDSQPARIELLGVSYKPCFTEDDDDDAVVEGCTDSTANNFDSSATDDDGSCEYAADTSCTINSQCAEGEICESGTCVEKIEGCLDSNSSEYDSSANVDDGTCISCKTGYDKDSTGLCSACVEGYSKDAAGNCYEDEEETDFPWLVVAGLGVALIFALS